MPFTALPDAVQGIDRIRKEAEGPGANEKQAFIPRANTGSANASAGAAAAGAGTGDKADAKANGSGSGSSTEQDTGSFSCYSRVGAGGKVRSSKFARTKSHGLLAAVDEGTERATGLVTTAAGDMHSAGYADGDAGEAKFNFPNALCVDGHAHDASHKPVLYVADSLNWRVRKLDTGKNKVKTVAGSTERTASDNWGSEQKFAYPSAIDVDAHGDVYVADMKAHSVRRVSAKDGAIATLAASNSPAPANALDINTPEGLCIDHAGFIYVSCSASDRILRIDPAIADELKRVSLVAGGGVRQTFANGPGPDASFNRPAGIAVDADDNLYVADRDNHCIRKLTKVARRKSASASSAAQAAADAAPPQWVVSTLAGVPGKKGYADGAAGEALFDTPYGVAVDHSGNVFVADSWNHAIRKICQKNGPGAVVVSTVAGDHKHHGGFDGEGTGASFYLPTGVCVDPTGNLFVSESAGNSIRRVVVRDAAAGTGGGLKADGDHKADGDKADGDKSGADAKDESNGRVCSSAMPKWLQWF